MIAIIDYNAGNVASVANALERLGANYAITSDPEVVERADKIIFPGVGAAGAAMKELKARQLDTVLRRATQPVLGICLGLQLLAERSEEGDIECLGIIPGIVRRFPNTLTVPQIGWNKIVSVGPRDLAALQSQYFYFIHSYFLPVGPHTVAYATYGLPFSAIVRKDNFLATQFHPEKSGPASLKFLQNFIRNS